MCTYTWLSPYYHFYQLCQKSIVLCSYDQISFPTWSRGWRGDFGDTWKHIITRMQRRMAGPLSMRTRQCDTGRYCFARGLNRQHRETMNVSNRGLFPGVSEFRRSYIKEIQYLKYVIQLFLYSMLFNYNNLTLF